jgi:hypothetical protein
MTARFSEFLEPAYPSPHDAASDVRRESQTWGRGAHPPVIREAGSDPLAGLTPEARRASENFYRLARQVEATLTQPTNQRTPAPTELTEAEADRMLDEAMDSLWGTPSYPAPTLGQPLQETRTPAVTSADADQALDDALAGLWGSPAGGGR